MFKPSFVNIKLFSANLKSSKDLAIDELYDINKDSCLALRKLDIMSNKKIPERGFAFKAL